MEEAKQNSSCLEGDHAMEAGSGHAPSVHGEEEQQNLMVREDAESLMAPYQKRSEALTVPQPGLAVIVGIICITSITLGILLPLTLKGKSDEDKSAGETPGPLIVWTPAPAPPTSIPTPAPATPAPCMLVQNVTDYLLNNLPQSTLDAIANEPNSPQAQAFGFIKKDSHIYPDWRVKQRYAMTTLHFSATRNGPSSLSADTDECDWWGLHDPEAFEQETTVYLGDKVEGFPTSTTNPCGRKPSTSNNIFSRHSAQVVSAEGSDKVAIRNLWLVLENFRVTLPAEIALLTSLSSLVLQGSAYDAKGGLDWGSLGYATGVGGSLPSQIGLLSNLEVLHLAHHDLTGTIPTEIGWMTNLQALVLAYNELTGPIPSEIALLAPLDCVDLRQNNLNGTLPYPFKKDGEKGFTVLILSDNSFTGSMHTEYGNLGQMQHMDLANNQFGGTIPDAWILMSALTSLSLSSNDLTGYNLKDLAEGLTSLRELALADLPEMSIYTVLTNLPQLEKLDISYPGFDGDGDVPSPIQDMTNLRALDISHKNLTDLPSWLEDLTNIEKLDLSQNNLTVIPPSIFSMTDLETLDLAWNGFRSIPTEFGLLTGLEDLDVGSNRLNEDSSSLPTELGLLTLLTSLSLRNMSIGMLPSDLFLLTNLRTLGLSYNKIGTTIPTEMASLGQLASLHIGSNAFFGTIPTQVGLLSNIEEFGAGDNFLTGTIPSQMGYMTAGHWLTLYNNSLTGTIPTELTFESMDVTMNDLTGTVPEHLCGNIAYFNCSESLCGCDSSCDCDQLQ